MTEILGIPTANDEPAIVENDDDEEILELEEVNIIKSSDESEGENEESDSNPVQNEDPIPNEIPHVKRMKIQSQIRSGGSGGDDESDSMEESGSVEELLEEKKEKKVAFKIAENVEIRFEDLPCPICNPKYFSKAKKACCTMTFSFVELILILIVNLLNFIGYWFMYGVYKSFNIPFVSLEGLDIFLIMFITFIAVPFNAIFLKYFCVYYAATSDSYVKHVLFVVYLVDSLISFFVSVYFIVGYSGSVGILHVVFLFDHIAETSVIILLVWVVITSVGWVLCNLISFFICFLIIRKSCVTVDDDEHEHERKPRKEKKSKRKRERKPKRRKPSKKKRRGVGKVRRKRKRRRR